MTKKIVCSLVTVLILLLLPVSMLAEETSGIQNEPFRISCVDELRESNSDTYLMSDGTYECVVYAEDKYYKDDNGNYAELDHRIIEAPRTRSNKKYSYKNVAGDVDVYFYSNIPSVYLESQNESLSFSMLRTNRIKGAVLGGSSEKLSVHDYDLYGDNFIAYENIISDTDVIYQMKNGCLKEYVVLKSASAPTEFSFDFSAEGYTVEKAEEGTVVFKNANGETVFELGSLFAVDTNGEYTDALDYSIEKTSKDHYKIAISISEDYIDSSERAFPVLIDPSVMITGASDTYDTFVSNKGTYASKNFYLEKLLRVGKCSDYGLCRSYISFKIPNDLSTKTITNGYIRLKRNDGSATHTVAYKVGESWKSKEVTWCSQPVFFDDEPIGSAVLDKNSWYKIGMTDLVKTWCKNSSKNYGVVLCASDEGKTSNYAEYRSSDYGYPNRPELHIVYSDTPSDIVFENNSVQLAPGKSTYIKVKNYQSNELVWSSSNSRVASINSKTGYVTANACGIVTIKAYLAKKPSISASMTLTVTPATTQTSGITSGCVYMIKNVSQGKYLSAGTSGGTGVSLANKDVMDGRQLWYVKWTGNGYRLYSMGHKDIASAGVYECLLRGCAKGSTPGYGSENASYLTWSIHKYNGYYYLTNTTKGQNTSVSYKSSNDTVSCIDLANESVYARWSFEKIASNTFNNYYDGGYFGYTQGEKLYIKINVDWNSVYDSSNKIFKVKNFNVLNSQNNPWNNLSPNVVIYGPNDAVPGWINPIIITVKCAEIPDSIVGKMYPLGYGGVILPDEASFYQPWYGAIIKLNCIADDEEIAAYTDRDKEKFILHELGHALKLAHPSETEHLFNSSDIVERGGYPTSSIILPAHICSLMNQGFPDDSGDQYICARPKWHDIINFKNKWG